MDITTKLSDYRKTEVGYMVPYAIDVDLGGQFCLDDHGEESGTEQDDRSGDICHAEVTDSSRYRQPIAIYSSAMRRRLRRLAWRSPPSASRRGAWPPDRRWDGTPWRWRGGSSARRACDRYWHS